MASVVPLQLSGVRHEIGNRNLAGVTTSNGHFTTHLLSQTYLPSADSVQAIYTAWVAALHQFQRAPFGSVF